LSNEQAASTVARSPGPQQLQLSSSCHHTSPLDSTQYKLTAIVHIQEDRLQ